MNVKDKQCIICLEREADDTTQLLNNDNELPNELDIQNIMDIKHINKTCTCVVYAHKKCIVKWLKKKPACPFCSTLITCPALTLDLNAIDVNTNELSIPNHIQLDDRCYNALLYVVFILCFLLVCNYILFYI